MSERLLKMLSSWPIIIITDQSKEVNFLFTEHFGEHSILWTLLVPNFKPVLADPSI
jgi:hypothetical protein